MNLPKVSNDSIFPPVCVRNLSLGIFAIIAMMQIGFVVMILLTVTAPQSTSASSCSVRTISSVPHIFYKAVRFRS
jgi:hypothetical protein